MSEIISISVERDDVDYVRMRALKPSHIYRRAVAELRDSLTAEDYQRKMKSWKRLFDIAKNFIELHELRKEFEEELNEWNKKN